MKVLIAASDRDFAMSFRRLFEFSGNQADNAYDGTQIISIFAENKYDIVILEKKIPRIPYSDIISFLSQAAVPVILLTDGSVSVSQLIKDPLPSAFLSFPFFPDELIGLADNIFSMFTRDEKIKVGDAELSLKKFMLCDKIPVTYEEISILIALRDNCAVPVRHPGAYINALNFKLEKLQKKSRIRYILGEGYKMVINNE